jgi:ATP-dependent RNA helicase RhlE
MPHYQNRRYDRNGRPQVNRNAGNRRQPKKDYIHPSRFIQSVKAPTLSQYSSTNTFADFAVAPLIKNNLKLMGFSDPSPIQDQAIPAALEGRDIVGIANTGTGKTAAFAIPLLNSLLKDRNSKALILAPTRELAQQIEEQCRQIAKGSGLNGVLLIGGMAMGPQLRELRYNPQIIIGTPGRIKDHIDRRSLDLAKCNLLVLDEVDRMLDMGFLNNIRYILDRTNSVKQSFYFSATLDNRVKSIIDGFSNDPVLISVKSGETNDNIDQNIIAFNSVSDKLDKLHDLLIQKSTIKALVFDDTHRSVEKLSKELEARGFSADSIHGGKSQSQRQRVLKNFRDNRIKILVATDVASRGLDVSDISHVINYSSPQTYDDYIHRIGRTGRTGKIGYALTFLEQ